MRLLQSISLDAGENLATEERLLNDGLPCIFLWRSRPAVVIGRHQIIEDEVRPDSDIPVFRRITGGGAIYMDEGNLNICFVGDKKIREAAAVLAAALRNMGVPAEFAGRNDIIAAGRKVSGWAGIERGGVVMTHGTLMFNVNLDRLEQVLTPSADKLARHGVVSVRSRVANIREFLPKMNFESFRKAIVAFLASQM